MQTLFDSPVPRGRVRVGDRFIGGSKVDLRPTSCVCNCEGEVVFYDTNEVYSFDGESWRYSRTVREVGEDSYGYPIGVR